LLRLEEIRNENENNGNGLDFEEKEYFHVVSVDIFWARFQSLEGYRKKLEVKLLEFL
jgi:hypothetical protein